MNLIKNLWIFFIIGLMVSCSTDGFEELNTDKKNPSVIPGEPLVTNALRNMGRELQEVNVNRNVFRLYAQYWAQCTYPEESQYNMVTRNIPDNMWEEMYRDVLADLNEASIIISGETPVGDEAIAVQNNKLAIINVVEAFCYTYLVDVFGDCSYTEAFDVDIALPTYDEGSAVYAAEIASLQSAIGSLNDAYGSYAGTSDPFYGGNVGQWKIFANSLLLKLGLRTQNQSLITAAVAGGVMSSSADDFSCMFESESPQTNPLWEQLVQSGRDDFIPANTLIDVMNNLRDPRRAVWFVADSAGGYVGGVYGTANVFSAFTHFSDVLSQPDLPGNLMSYSETEFLLAEAAERGLGVSDGQAHYEAAIRASFADWGAAGVDDYLAQADVAYAAGDLERLGIQKWISLFNNGFEGWTTYRIFNFASIMNPAEGLTVGDIPTRFIFPVNEATLNGANRDAAAARYNDDSKTAKVFWDN